MEACTDQWYAAWAERTPRAPRSVAAPARHRRSAAIRPHGRGARACARDGLKRHRRSTGTMPTPVTIPVSAPVPPRFVAPEPPTYRVTRHVEAAPSLVDRVNGSRSRCGAGNGAANVGRRCVWRASCVFSCGAQAGVSSALEPAGQQPSHASTSGVRIIDGADGRSCRERD